MTQRIIWAAWLAASIGIGCLTALGCGDLGPSAPSSVPAIASPLPLDAATRGPLTQCPVSRICPL